MDKQMPRCPGCGKEMRPYQAEGYAPRYACECGWLAPMGFNNESAYIAAMTRWQEPNRVLTLEDAGNVLVRLEPVWLEIKRMDGGCWYGNGDMIMATLKQAYRGHPLSYRPDNEWDDDYGKLWRCWFRRPTDEERANAPWEMEGQG